MKEKKIDTYLSLASFTQLLILAFGGASVAEIVSEHPRQLVLCFGSLLTLTAIFLLLYFYLKVFDIIKRKKS